MDEEGDRRGSKYAAEGTAAHFLVEECIVDDLDPRDQVGRRIYVDEEGDAGWMGEDEAHTYASEWIFEVDPEMVGGAMTFMQCAQDALLTMEPDGVQYVEERVSPGHPDLGGTLDWAYVSNQEAAIADLKYGRGVVVDVQDNPQQMIYALGLLANHPEVQTIDSYIVQPRAPHVDGPIRLAVYTREELESFYGWLLTRVEAAQAPGSKPRVAGEHCRFCPELAICPAVAALADKAAATDFTEMDDGEALAEAMTLTPIVTAWVKAVRQETLDRLMGDIEVPGWKLVHGRGTRNWIVEAAELLKLARKVGLLKRLCYSEPKLLSPYAIEQAAAKKGKLTGRQAKIYFGDLWESTPGGPAIAPENDPRDTYRRSPEDDFDAQ
jgi:hypothetical protein